MIRVRREFAEYRPTGDFSGAGIGENLRTLPIIIFLSRRAQLYFHTVKMVGGSVFRKRDFADNLFGTFSVKKKDWPLLSGCEAAEMYAIALKRGSHPITFV